MPGVTPISGWANLTEDDPFATYPTIIDQALEDIENDRTLGTNAFAASAPVASYPFGASVMALSSDNSGGWPSGGTGVVVTMRGLGDRTTQWWYRLQSDDIPQAQIRTGGSTGWNPWAVISGPGSIRAVATGVAVFANTNTPGQMTVAFPAGRFTTAPVVTATPADSRAVVSVSGVSWTGFTLGIQDRDSGATLPVTQDWAVNWIAVKEY